MTEDSSEGIRYRRYSGAMAIVVKTISIALPLYSILFILNIVGRYFHIVFYPVSFTALFLALVLILIFLLIPATRSAPKYKLPWYDALLCLASLAPTVYIFINFERIFLDVQQVWATPTEQTLFVVLIVVLFEAMRRTVGWPVLVLAAFFMLHAEFGYILPGLLGAVPFSFSGLTTYMYLYDTGIFGFVLGLAATIIIAFVTFGHFLNQAGGGKFFINLALSISGRVRGGPAKVAIVSSALFGTISGSPAANVGVTGAVTIPMMKRLGYKPHFAAAVETIASTGGILTPPVMGAIAFVMADLTQTSYGAICIAALLPAALYYVCLYFQLDFEAARLKLAGLPRQEVPSARLTLMEGWPFLIPLVMLVILLMVLQHNPIESILYAIVAIVVISWFKKTTRMGLQKILNALAASGQAMMMIAPICAVVGIIMGSVSLTGLGINLSVVITEAAGSQLWTLAILAGVAIYLSGMGISILIIYIVFAILVAPAMVELGVPILAAHMFIFYAGASMFFTPPFCPSVYIAASMAGAPMWKTAFQAMKLGIVCYLIPFVLIFKPAILLIGSSSEIIIAIATSLIGALFLAVGVEGYFLRAVTWWQRILFFAGGICMFIPGWMTDVAGIVMAILPLLLQVKARKTS